MNKITLKIALFAIVSIISEDAPDTISKNYIEYAMKIGEELTPFEDDIDYEKIIEEIIEAIEK